VSQALNLLRQGASDVLNGNLLTLPAGGGMLYVQPVYLKSTGETSYPTLQRVLVAFGDKIGFAPTLDEALNQLFGGRSGATAGDCDNNGQTPAPPGRTFHPGRTADAKAALKAALDEANGDQGRPGSTGQGRLCGYGEQQKKLSARLKKALDAEAKIPWQPGHPGSPDLAVRDPVPTPFSSPSS
jgi:uncharacterized membrane protein (UPF0182 family)